MAENLADVWRHTVEQAPSASAVIDAATARTWTRGELAAAVAACASALPAPSELQGRRVVLAQPNSAEWLVVFLALQQAGAVPVSLDTQEPAATQVAIATAIGAAWFWREGSLEAVPLPGRIRREQGTCLVKLTSGTTGTPRALPFTAAQMMADGWQVCRSMGISAADRNLAVIPLGHSYGLGNLVLPLLLQGTTLVIGAGPWPQAMAEDCRRWQVSVLPAVPALLRAMTRADIDPATLASLRLIISAGAPLAAETAQEFAAKFDRRIQVFYGSSETGGICFDRHGDATLTGRSVGPPLEGVQLTWRRGNRFVVTSAAVMGRGRQAPPDRGQFNALGELVLLGRAGRMMKIAGRRVDLTEIETVLRTLPGVREAHAAPDPQEAEAVAAVIATGENADAAPHQPAALRVALASRLAPWKIPHRFVVVAEFPLTARGKPDRRKLQAMLVAHARAHASATTRPTA